MTMLPHYEILDGDGVNIQAAPTFNAVVTDFLTLHGIAKHGATAPETR